MKRLYRAVPIDDLHAARLSVLAILAASDLDATKQAKQHFGPDFCFALWEGERHALTHRPLAALLRMRAQVRAAPT